MKITFLNVLVGAVALGMSTTAASAATFTYDFTGSFAHAWSLDNNNGRTPIAGGPASGFFVLDIDDVTHVWSVLDYTIYTTQPLLGLPQIDTVYDHAVQGVQPLPGAPLAPPAAALQSQSATTGTINVFNYDGVESGGNTWAIDFRHLTLSINPYQMGYQTTLIQIGERYGGCGFNPGPTGAYNICGILEGQQYDGWATATLRAANEVGPGVTPVPLPAAGLLLLGGLGGLGLLSRRRP